MEHQVQLPGRYFSGGGGAGAYRYDRQRYGGTGGAGGPGGSSNTAGPSGSSPSSVAGGSGGALVGGRWWW